MEKMSTYNSSCLYEFDEMSLSDSNGTLYVLAGPNLGGVLAYCHNFMNHLVEEAKGSPTKLIKNSLLILTCNCNYWSSSVWPFFELFQAEVFFP